MMTPWYLSIFVPDCPLYTFLMIFALIFLVLGKRYNTFNTIVTVGLSMYGTWTMLVLLYFNELYFSPANALMSTGLFVSHGGMALESVLLLPYLKKTKIIHGSSRAPGSSSRRSSTTSCRSRITA